MSEFDKKKFIKKLIISIVTIIAIVGIGYLFFYLLGWTDMTREELQAFVVSTGAIAPLAFIAISFLQVTFIPIPGAITILAGNYVFGAGLSFLYSYIGMLGGAMFAFFLGKVLGRKFVNWIAGSAETVDEWIKKLKGRENVLLFFMFLLPFFPDDLLCAIAGLFPLSYFGFFLMQALTRATSIGATLLFMSGEVIPYHGWGLVVLAVISVLAIIAFIISYKNAEKINVWFSEFTDKIFKRK